MNNYIDVFNASRNADMALLTLWDDEGIRLFFGLVCSSEEYRKFFRDGQMTLVSFNASQSLQTGTGYYEVVNGKIKVRHETGILQGLLGRIQFDRIAASGTPAF
jgi:hypothetical protein